MNISKSLRFKLVLGFLAVMLPLVVFVYINNIYAKQIVRDKVSETYRNILDIFAEQVDNNLIGTNEYLYKMADRDPDVSVIMSYPQFSDEYMLTKIRVNNQIARDIGFYNLLDTIFLYQEEDLIFTSNSDYLTIKDVIHNHIGTLIGLEKSQTPEKWHLLYDEQIDGGYFLARISRVSGSEGLYTGVFVKIADIARLLDILWNEGKIGETVIYSRTGAVLSERLSASTITLGNLELSQGEMSRTIENPDNKERYLVISQKSNFSDIMYNIVIPENNVLQNLPFLQRAAYFIPVVIIIILMLYLLFLRNVMFKPLAELMRGMKKVSLGMLDARLQEEKSNELKFLANSFNNMAEQVKKLKIGVYEEQLRVQQAELKQLQAQINPHFYMNSLNIIYNFAAISDNESVKKMALHLADYFRFIMKTNRNTISLDEELKHIENYLEIQKLRFPNKLQFELNMPPGINDYPIPALAIQPFIENAIIHGFKNRKRPFVIRIDIDREDPQYAFRLTISDNGVGFTEEVMAALNGNEILEETVSSRLGILNVIHRLRLYFDGKARVEIFNNSQGGAVVRLYFPHMKEDSRV